MAWRAAFGKGGAQSERLFPAFHTAIPCIGWKGRGPFPTRRCDRARPSEPAPGGVVDRVNGTSQSSVLELALERLDLLGEDVIVAGQVLDLAHGVQHGGVIAAAEPPADLRERA